jgi:hypothetical protein
MGTRTVQMKGVLPWLVRWACSALAALLVPKKMFFSSPYTISIFFVPIAQQARQAVVLGRLSPRMCPWLQSSFRSVVWQHTPARPPILYKKASNYWKTNSRPSISSPQVSLWFLSQSRSEIPTAPPSCSVTCRLF